MLVDKLLKTTETDTHVYFLKGPYSNWHPSTFDACIFGTTITRTFSCNEQYMMACKAHLFGDSETLEAIMATTDPAAHKALGRKVRNFDPALWDSKAQDIVFEGALAKFQQNPEQKAYMLGHGAKILVEGAHYDPVWGVGLAWNDPLILDEANWKGKNWLGKTLMRVRGAL